MKKRFIFLLPSIIILIITGCEKNNTKETPIYNTPAITTPRQNNDRNTDLALEYEYFTDFKGVTAVPNYSESFGRYSDNASINMPSFFCCDEDGDMLYYVNYGEDGYLYSYDGGKSELVIEMPVYNPNYFDGVIYFLSNGENLPGFYDWFWTGKLYKYSLNSKTAEPVLDLNIFNLSVHGGYLYFYGEYVFDGNKIVGGGEGYRIPIDGGEPEKLGGFLPIFYGEYQLKFSNAGDIREVSVDIISDTETVPLTGIGNFRELYLAVYEDKFWFRTPDFIASIDLRNGETKIYTPNKEIYCPPGGEPNLIYAMDKMGHFAVLDDVLYVVSGMNLFRYNSETDSFIPMKLFGTGNYCSVAADKKGVYGMLVDGNPNGGAFSVTFNRFIPSVNGEYNETEING